MILRPQRNFTVVRQIANHTDTDTYYVRAVIRNTYTDAIIETLDLTNRGSQRFSKNWQVPADPSGQGLEISIVTSVYTDSGYTTKSENYGDEENSYLIEDKEVNGRSGGYVGAGGGPDARTIRRIIQEELDKVKPEPIEIPKPKEYEMRWDDILNAVKEIKSSVNNVANKKPDYSVLIDAMKELYSAIEKREVTPATDVSPMMNMAEFHKNELKDILNQMHGFMQSQEEMIVKIVTEKLPNALQNIQFVSAPMNFADGQKFLTVAKGAVPKEESPVDVNQISQ